MGAGASTIADYKEAASKSDESSFPEAFAKLKEGVEAFEGDDAAALGTPSQPGAELEDHQPLAPVVLERRPHASLPLAVCFHSNVFSLKTPKMALSNLVLI